MADTVTQLGDSLIQHGPENNRIYLMHLSLSDLPDLTTQLDALAAERGYTKIFAKVPAEATEHFLGQGYVSEAVVPRFYDGQNDAVFMGKFIDPQRATSSCSDVIAHNLELARSRATDRPEGITTHPIRQANETDAAALAALYGDVFASYPFPVHDPAYIVKTMRSHVCYFVLEQDGAIVAASSGEMDLAHANAEMTDFATRPEHRRKGLATALLQATEPAMRARCIKTLYTIARAHSAGMNITFARCGYTFGGTLINNTQISGRIESMNIWYKGAAE